MKIDTHAHIFLANVKDSEVVRYVPNYNASANDYEKVLEQNGFTHGVLVQPSFLGTNNSYMLNALDEFSNLRAVAVIEPENIQTLCKYVDKICGIRLNLIGKDCPDFTSNEWLNCFKFLKENNMHLELHKELPSLLPIVEKLCEYEVPLMIDHLGRVSKDSFNKLSEFKRYANKNIYFKVSGFYRLDSDIALAKESFYELLKYFKKDNFVFGSDWPHTNYENLMSFDKAYNNFLSIIDDAALKEQILNDNAARLFKI